MGAGGTFTVSSNPIRTSSSLTLELMSLISCWGGGGGRVLLQTVAKPSGPMPETASLTLELRSLISFQQGWGVEGGSFYRQQ